MFYKNSVEEIERIIKNKHQRLESEKSNNPSSGLKNQKLKHILWMCQEIREMNTSDQVMLSKSAEYIGWIFCSMEEMLYFRNYRSRELADLDSKKGLNITH